MNQNELGLVLVTGASGFVGSALCEKLMNNGYPLRCHYRRKIPPETLIALEKKGAQLVCVDLAPMDKPPNDDVFLGLLEGVETIYHVAALTADWGNRELFEKSNVQATEQLLKAAMKSGVKKFIQISSLSVHGFGSHVESTEEGPWYPHTHYYQETKKKAEDLVRNMDTELFRCIIRPGDVYGPNDTTMMFPMFKAMEQGVMTTVRKGKALISPVYIDDLTEALLSVLNTPEAKGETFNITGGERINWKEFLNLAADALGREPPRRDAPVWLLRTLATVLTWIWKLIGARNAPLITPYRIERAVHDFHFDISKARKILKYSPQTSCREGLIKTAESYRAR